MKKKVYILLAIIALLVLLIIVLISISRNYSYTVYERPNVEYYGKKDGIVLLKDYDSYKEYLNHISDYEVEETFYEALATYEEEFFEKEMLIVIVHWERSGAVDISVKNIIYDESNIEVVLKRKVPHVMSSDMKDHGIIIRVPQNSDSLTVEYRTEK